MKRKFMKPFIISLFMGLGIGLFTACSNKEASVEPVNEQTTPVDNHEDDDSTPSNTTTTNEEESETKKVYNLYVASGGTETYEEWLESIRGADGSSILSGTGAPGASQGKVGDVYIDTSNWNVYNKNANGWTAVGNIKGQKGDQGDKPIITVGQNGNWFVDNVDTGTKAQGNQGDQGVSIVSITLVETTNNGKTRRYEIAFSEGEPFYYEVNDGIDGTNGLSAYELYCQENPTYEGTLGDWLNSLNGENGKSAFDIYKQYYPDYDGTEEQWVEAIARSLNCHTVTFNSNGGTPVDSQLVPHGEKATKPADPTCEGFTFEGWEYVDENETGDWVFFGYVVTENITLRAKWVSNYTFVEFEWASGNKTAKAVFLDNNSNTVKYDAQMNEEELESATCLDAGITRYIASYGSYSDYKDVEVPALGHDLVHHDGQAPTCTEVGWAAYDTCSRCDYTTYEEIPATGHDEVEIPYLAPTCTEPGHTAGSKCGVCDETIIASEEIPATGHTEVVDEAVAPTCTTPGLTEGKHCSVCNEILVAQEEIPALGHDLVHHDGQAPTCTEVGWEAYDTCSRCDYTTYVEIPADGTSHNYGSLIPEVPATYEAAGVKAHYVCEECGKLFIYEDEEYIEVTEEQLAIPQLVHTYSAYVVRPNEEEPVNINIGECLSPLDENYNAAYTFELQEGDTLVFELDGEPLYTVGSKEELIDNYYANYSGEYTVYVDLEYHYTVIDPLPPVVINHYHGFIGGIERASEPHDAPEEVLNAYEKIYRYDLNPNEEVSFKYDEQDLVFTMVDDIPIEPAYVFQADEKGGEYYFFILKESQDVVVYTPHYVPSNPKDNVVGYKYNDAIEYSGLAYRYQVGINEVSYDRYIVSQLVYENDTITLGLLEDNDYVLLNNATFGNSDEMSEYMTFNDGVFTFQQEGYITLNINVNSDGDVVIIASYSESEPEDQTGVNDNPSDIYTSGYRFILDDTIELGKGERVIVVSWNDKNDYYIDFPNHINTYIRDDAVGFFVATTTAKEADEVVLEGEGTNINNRTENYIGLPNDTILYRYNEGPEILVAPMSGVLDNYLALKIYQEGEYHPLQCEGSLDGGTAYRYITGGQFEESFNIYIGLWNGDDAFEDVSSEQVILENAGEVEEYVTLENNVLSFNGDGYAEVVFVVDENHVHVTISINDNGGEDNPGDKPVEPDVNSYHFYLKGSMNDWNENPGYMLEPATGENSEGKYYIEVQLCQGDTLKLYEAINDSFYPNTHSEGYYKYDEGSALHSGYLTTDGEGNLVTIVPGIYYIEIDTKDYGIWVQPSINAVAWKDTIRFGKDYVAEITDFTYANGHYQYYVESEEGTAVYVDDLYTIGWSSNTTMAFELGEGADEYFEIVDGNTIRAIKEARVNFYFAFENGKVVIYIAEVADPETLTNIHLVFDFSSLSYGDEGSFFIHAWNTDNDPLYSWDSSEERLTKVNADHEDYLYTYTLRYNKEDTLGGFIIGFKQGGTLKQTQNITYEFEDEKYYGVSVSNNYVEVESNVWQISSDAVTIEEIQ